MTKAERQTKVAPAVRPDSPGREPVPPQPRALMVIAVCAVLASTIWFTFFSVLSSGFVNYDDGEYIFDNPTVRQGLTARSIPWAFTATHSANWHPVTWLSHMVDVQIFGLNAGGHHGTNLLLHTLNAILLLLLLLNMTGALWRSALVAFLFALHPLHVESVAWVAERKDVLSTFFWMLTLFAWLGFVRSKRPAWYALSVVLYALGLMAKPMLVTLPFILLLLDYWPLNRLGLPQTKHHASLRNLVVEKIPFFTLSAASCIVTFIAQRGGGAVQTLAGISIPGRAVNAAWAYAAYLFKAVWPSSLAVFYPLPRHGHPAYQVALAAVVLLAATTGCLFFRRRAPYLAFGWFLYLGTLVPVIGLVQVGSQEMADRYTYVPLIGIFIIVAWGLARLAGDRRPLLLGATALSGILLVALLGLTRLQVRTWKDSEALFRRAIAVTTDNCVAQNDLGLVLFNKGKREEGVAHLEEAIRIKPDYADAHDNLGIAMDRLGRHEEAVRHFKMAVQCGSRSPVAMVTLGNTLVAEGRLDGAIDYFREAIRLKPDFGDARSNLGAALAAQGRHAEAAEEFRRTLELQPDNANARHLLGRSFAALGRHEEAIRNFREALRLKPDFTEAHNDLGAALAGAGRFDEAVSQYREALRLKPDDANAHNNLGLALASMGRMPEASEQFGLALRFRPNFADAHNNLGVALARQGQVREAQEQFREALRIQPDFPNARANLLRMEVKPRGGPNP
jgi:protein O-mannosyl-transferase